jgi:co-chaperonin GroES (HSP10)
MTQTNLTPADLEGIQLVGNRFLVDIIEDKSKTSSGILLHAYRVENYFRAVVLKSNVSEAVSVGDIVVIAKNMGKDARIGDAKYLVFDGLEGVVAKIGRVNDLGEHEIYGNTEL